MPSRLIREGILTSETVNKIDEKAECFYRRLLNVVDDYGTFPMNLKLIRSACYPMKIDAVSDRDTELFLSACVENDLVKIYNARFGQTESSSWVSMKTAKQTDYKNCFLYVLNFRQSIRSKCKNPLPPKDADVFLENSCLQLNANENKCDKITNTNTTSTTFLKEGESVKGEENIASDLPERYAKRIRELKTHESFKRVPNMQIVNTLKIHPEDKWDEAIEKMLRHYAGTHIQRPCGSLENYLVGRPQDRKKANPSRFAKGTK